MFHDAQGVKVVIEDVAKSAHFAIECLLTRVTKWRMPDVMNEGERFSEIGIQAQRPGNGPRDLRDFYGVRESVAKMVGAPIGEYLRFIFQPSKCARVDDAVAIPLKIRSIRL